MLISWAKLFAKLVLFLFCVSLLGKTFLEIYHTQGNLIRRDKRNVFKRVWE
jgi:uncharacterized membrane protein (DUF373 family)